MSSHEGVQYFDLPSFKFQDGTTLDNVRLAYQEFNPQGTRIAVIPTCFRGRIASTLNFAQGVLRDYRVLVVALFGNGESSSPSNTRGFPQSLDYRDCVRAQHELLVQRIGVRSIDVVLGFSMGGQCTYYWAAMYPEMVNNAVVICSSARTSRHNFQFLEGPRAALESSADYVAAGKRTGAGILEAPRGIRAFGKAYSAWLTSSEWFEQELYRELGFQDLASWDRAVTEDGYQGWDPDDLLVMLGMWQRGDVSVCDANSGGSLEAALSKITTRVLLMPCQTDQYFTSNVSEKEAKLIRIAECKVIPSIWGHIAGGGASQRDVAWMDEQISGFLTQS
ncbi:hypothetical protein diail_9689 [Diaporthe ilicicola]|nr:hypothetical protein diail_9689 [Diaporthe ilicicola]